MRLEAESRHNHIISSFTERVCPERLPGTGELYRVDSYCDYFTLVLRADETCLSASRASEAVGWDGAMQFPVRPSAFETDTLLPMMKRM